METSSPSVKGNKLTVAYGCQKSSWSPSLYPPRSTEKGKKRSPHLGGDRFIPTRASADTGSVLTVEPDSGNRTPHSWFSNASPFAFDEAMSATDLPSQSASLLRASPKPKRLLHFGKPVTKKASSPFLDPGRIFTENLRALTPKRTRKFREDPHRVLTAPDLKDNLLYTPVAWSKQNLLSVALDDMLFFTDAAPELLEVYQKSPVVSEALEISDLYRTIRTLLWDEEGEKLAVGNRKSLELVDGVTLKRLNPVLSADANSLSLAWHGSLLACGRTNGKLYLQDVRSSNHIITDQLIHGSGVSAVRWNEDGNRIASSDTDGIIKIWDVRSLTKPIYKLKAHNSAVKALNWCPWDRNTLASGSFEGDTKLKFWDMIRGSLSQEKDVAAPVVSLCWNEEYKEIATALYAPLNLVRIWKHSDMSDLGKLVYHQDRIISMIQSADGTSLATVGTDAALCIWRCWPKQARKESYEVRSPLSLTLR